MAEYNAVSDRDGVVYDKPNYDYSTTDRDIIAYGNEKKEFDYGSVKSEVCAFNIHGEDSRLNIEAFEAGTETAKAESTMNNEHHELGVSRMHRFGTFHWVSTHLVVFFIGCVLINVWPHPKMDFTQHERFLQEREDCMRLFKACTMNGSTNSICTDQFVVCGSNVANRNDQCTADYVDCTNLASSLKGDNETEAFRLCNNQLERCQEYGKHANWKPVAFVIMVLTVIGYLSQSPPIFLFVLFVEIVIGIYTDSFRGYALGSFLAGMVLPCVGGVPITTRIQVQ